MLMGAECCPIKLTDRAKQEKKQLPNPLARI